MSVVSNGAAGGERGSDYPAAESRLDRTRDEFRQLFLREEEDEFREPRRFPRSKILRMLTTGNALTILAIGAGGFFLLKPRLLRSVIRVVPVGALFRLAVIRFMTRKR